MTTLNSTFSDGLEELRLLDVPNRFNLTLIAPSFNYEPWYGDNATDQTHWMESFIIRELVPFGDSFATDGQIPQRFVLGFSKSGNGALFLILRHPNVFSAAAAWDSPAQLNDISAFSFLPMNFGTQANFDLYNIPNLVATNAAPFTQRNRLWISGDQSAWTADMIQLHNQMTAASIPHTWVNGGPRRTVGAAAGWTGPSQRLMPMLRQSRLSMSMSSALLLTDSRSPRLTFRPGTQEIWLADKGWKSSEEIDRIPNATDGILENFGWPCYEGTASTDYSVSSICTLLYSQPAATTDPYFMYDHQQEVVIGDPGGVGSGAISGLAFYGSGSYPVNYQGALFFSDNVRNRIWVMFNGTDGLPDPQQSGDLPFGGSEPGGSEDGAGRRSILCRSERRNDPADHLP